MPVSRHWRGLKQYDNCFAASDAIQWLHHHLVNNPNFGKTVTREQTTKLLKWVLKTLYRWSYRLFFNYYFIIFPLLNYFKFLSTILIALCVISILYLLNAQSDLEANETYIINLYFTKTWNLTYFKFKSYLTSKIKRKQNINYTFHFT